MLITLKSCSEMISSRHNKKLNSDMFYNAPFRDLAALDIATKNHVVKHAG